MLAACRNTYLAGVYQEMVGSVRWNVIDPLKTKRICFIQGLSPYRAVNTLHFGYKNQSLNIL
jgi:hypothetical protein